VNCIGIKGGEGGEEKDGRGAREGKWRN